ncbi:ABC transporter ATP-binding protein [Rhodoplanes sp. Z2-YC6860]|uniref:ABC transporter ATP-binding protein n=1 Tax=Rhodoplanes sp. Z2-YC6860 TaxID=674703 RepID=UPI00078EC886|nr:ABC transporter ATP-binding protein [Rhodoplanes sp. Z2-YC6860]AMN40650.1 ABC transporter ATPase/permease [Rhodoplanes sp. Z2-YC6860]
MDEPQRHADRPFAFILSYVRRRKTSHIVIVAAILAAVACATGTQYGVKSLVDALSSAPQALGVWTAFALLVSLITADNLLWRIAGWVSSSTFVSVTGDLRRDLFRHLTGHSLSYFAERGPGTLSSRITAASNAIFTLENLFIWNVLPPCVATAAAIALVATVSVPMALGLSLLSGIMVLFMFRLAAAGQPLHHEFADKAAAIDGEMVDVISNVSLVRAFGGRRREHRRFDGVVDLELTARQRSLRYLEKLRLIHASFTILLTIGLLAWAIALWQRGQATTGDVILACTLGLTILHATRDLAVALVDATQHMARLAEALPTLLVPHEMTDHPEAKPLVPAGAKLTFERVSFRYPDGHGVFNNFNLEVEPGQRVGLIGQSGAGKSSLFTLMQRFYAVQGGRILIDGQDIAHITQDSLRESIAIVPQDVSLFQRSVMENIRYGRPDASDDMVLAAALAARCEFINDLPMGFDTIVGSRGLKLSGGQRQRIAIARAFLRDAPLLLLDEATSALDSESEEAIRESLGRLMQGRTVIAIAHRLSTVRGFDRIVLLENGRVMEDGAPDHLLRRDGPYRRLIRTELGRLKQTAAA